jgi:hypothetical protein
MSISHTPSTRPLLISGHVTTHSRKFPFKSANSPFAERQRIADRKRPLLNLLIRFFLAEWYFITNLGPQVNRFLVLFFGVNRNHAKSSIHHKEVHTRSSLPVDHPYLSQDLTMKLSS